MSSVWQLNAVVLSHSNRFFQAAARAVSRVEAEARGRGSRWVALAGNLLWAQSPFISEHKGEEEVMALAGAVAGSLAEDIAPSPATGLAELVSAQERQLLLCADVIVARLQRELNAGGDAVSPAQVNRRTWERLFPDYRYEASTLELEQTIAERLASALGRTSAAA